MYMWKGSQKNVAWDHPCFKCPVGLVGLIWMVLEIGGCKTAV